MDLSFASDDGDGLISALLTSPGLPAGDGGNVGHSLSSLATSIQHNLSASMASAVAPTTSLGGSASTPQGGASFGGVTTAPSSALPAAAALKLAQQESRILELEGRLNDSAANGDSTTPPGAGSAVSPLGGIKRRRMSSPRSGLGAVQPGARALEVRLAATEEANAGLEVTVARLESELKAAQEAAAAAQGSAAAAKAALASERAAATEARQSLETQLLAARQQAIAMSVPPPAPAPASAALQSQHDALERRLGEQAAAHEAQVAKLLAEVAAAKEASAHITPAAPASAPAAPLGDVDVEALRAEVAALQRANMTLRREVSTAQRRERRSRAAVSDTVEEEHGIAVLREQVSALTAQVGRLQGESTELPRVTASLARAGSVCHRIAQRLTTLVQGSTEGSTPAAPTTPVSVEDTLAAATAGAAALHAAADTAESAWASATAEATAASTTIGTLQARIGRAERGAAEQSARAAALEVEVAETDAKRISAAAAAAAAERRVASLQREVSSLEGLLASFEGGSAAGAAPSTPGGPAHTGHLKESLAAARDEIATLRAASASMTPNAAMGKLSSQVGSLKEQVEAGRKALASAHAAQDRLLQENAALLARAGKGGYDSSTTKVLHMRANPAAAAASAAKEGAAALVAELQEEVGRLRAAAAASGGAAPAATGSSAVVPAADLEQAKKRAERLMEVFSKKIKAFRNGVYLLTGWKLDMDLRPDGSATFAMRSKFAELESDSLKFRISPQEDVDMEETPYCPSRVDPKVYATLALVNSVPAFVAQLALDLHGRQTFVGLG